MNDTVFNLPVFAGQNMINQNSIHSTGPQTLSYCSGGKPDRVSNRAEHRRSDMRILINVQIKVVEIACHNQRLAEG